MIRRWPGTALDWKSFPCGKQFKHRRGEWFERLGALTAPGVVLWLSCAPVEGKRTKCIGPLRDQRAGGVGCSPFIPEPGSASCRRRVWRELRTNAPEPALPPPSGLKSASGAPTCSRLCASIHLTASLLASRVRPSLVCAKPVTDRRLVGWCGVLEKLRLVVDFKAGVPGRGAVRMSALWSARTCPRFPGSERSGAALAGQPGLPTGALGVRSGRVDGCWGKAAFLKSGDKSPHSKSWSSARSSNAVCVSTGARIWAWWSGPPSAARRSSGRSSWGIRWRGVSANVRCSGWARHSWHYQLGTASSAPIWLAGW